MQEKLENLFDFLILHKFDEILSKDRLFIFFPLIILTKSRSLRFFKVQKDDQKLLFQIEMIPI